MPKRAAQNTFSIIRAGAFSNDADFLKIPYFLFHKHLAHISLPHLPEISSQARKLLY